MRILYVDIDTLRPDHLGCYGYPRATSTNIDKVAEDSVRFTDVYCSDAPCLPSRAALMTGRFGIHTGCVGHGGVNAEMRWEGRNRGMADFNGRYNLPAVLRRAGMKTASISSFPDRHAAWWFNGGFDETYNIGKRGLEPAHEVIPVALDWLDRKRDTKDWFLHVHVWDPHIPYRTPTEYGEPFKDAPLPDPWMTQEILDKHRATKPGGHSACEVTGYDNKPNPATPRQPVEIKNTDDFRHMIDEYDTGIWYADKQLGLLFDKLRAAMPDLVIRTSLICGLPGEGEAEFEELCGFLRQQKLQRAGVFQFSAEEGTLGERMDGQIAPETAARRVELVVDLQSRIMDAYNEQRLGTVMEVLCEGFDSQAGCYVGRTYADSVEIDGRVLFTAAGLVPAGEFVRVRITGVADGDLTGEIED